MDPFTLGAIANIAGGVLGNALGGGAGDSGISEQQLKEWQALQVPDIDKMRVYLDRLASQGQLTPEALAAEQLSQTAQENIALDPRLRQNYMNALNQMAGYAEKGLTDVDRAQLEDMLKRSAADEQSRQKAILENRAARGVAGSGDELSAALSSSQSSANRASDEGLKLAAMAQQRRFEGTRGLSDIAQQIEQADYNKQANLASARDRINEFNTRLRQDVAQSNVGARNRAAEMNLAERQRLADTNVGLSNQEQKSNKELLQQDYENRLRRLTGMSGASGNASTAASGRSAATANMWSGIGSGIGQIAMNKYQSDNDLIKALDANKDKEK